MTLTLAPIRANFVSNPMVSIFVPPCLVRHRTVGPGSEEYVDFRAVPSIPLREHPGDRSRFTFRVPRGFASTDDGSTIRTVRSSSSNPLIRKLDRITP